MTSQSRRRGAAPKSSFEAQSICFFCRSEEIPEIKSKHRVGIRETDEDLYKQRQASSLCKTFGLSNKKTSPIFYFLSQAKFCAKCTEAVADLDFTLCSLEKLESQYLLLKSSLADRLKVNALYRQPSGLLDSTAAGVDIESIKNLPYKFTYPQVVEIVYESTKSNLYFFHSLIFLFPIHSHCFLFLLEIASSLDSANAHHSSSRNSREVSRSTPIGQTPTSVRPYVSIKKSQSRLDWMDSTDEDDVADDFPGQDHDGNDNSISKNPNDVLQEPEVEMETPTVKFRKRIRKNLERGVIRTLTATALRRKYKARRLKKKLAETDACIKCNRTFPNFTRLDAHVRKVHKSKFLSTCI